MQVVSSLFHQAVDGKPAEKFKLKTDEDKLVSCGDKN